MIHEFGILEIIFFLSVVAIFECKVCNVRRSYICGQYECRCRETKQGKVCRNCDDWCERLELIECLNGECTNDECQCHACYSGANCGIYSNMFFPQFDQPEYTAIVKPFARGVLRGISATDLDDSECAEKTSEFCSCSYIIYRVFENSNESAKFQMNHDTGDLHFDVFEEGTVELIIAAYNYDADNNPDITDFRVGYSKVILYITNETPIGIRPDLREMERVPNIYNWKVQSFDVNVFEGHRRSKRQASSVPGESVAVIRATDGWELRSNVSFTDSIVLSLTISLSRGIHYLDAFVMSDVTTNGSPLFHFCEAAMGEVGSNLHIMGSDDVSLGRSMSNSYTNDIINISIVNVINDEADTSSSAANEIVITFTATVLNPTDVEYDTKPYYVSALVLDNSTEYLSVTNYTTNITAPEKYGTSSISTVFNGPSALNPGGRAMWDISLSVDAPVMNLTVDHGDSGNNSIEICDVQIISVGSSYMCYDEDQLVILKDNNELNDGLFRITINQLLNGDFKVDTSDDQVVVRVYGAIPSYAESGQNYTLSLLINNGTHVSNEMKAVKIDSSPPQQSTGTPSLDIATPNSAIAQSKVHILNISVSTNVNETDIYSVKITHSHPTTCRIHFCDVRLLRTGSNFVCGLPSFDIHFRNTSRMGVFDEVSIEFGSLLNVDLHSDSNGNEIEFSLSLCYLECDTLNVGDSFDVIATLAYGALTVSDSISLIIENPGVTLNQPPMMTVIQKNGATHIYYGGQALYEAQIELPPYTTYSNVYFELKTLQNIRPSVSICSVYISGVDPSLRCLASYNEPVYFANTFDGFLNEKASLNLGTIHNENPSSIFINVTFVIVLLDGNFQDGDIISIDVTLLYNTNKLNNQISSTYSSSSYGIQTFPEYNVSLNSAINSFRIGEAAIFDVIISLPLDFVSKLFLKAEAIDTEIEICRIYLSSRGSNIPCLADNDMYETKTAYPSDGYSSMQLDLHTVTQTGRFKDETANILLIRIAVALRNGFSYGSAKYLFQVQLWDEFIGTPWTETHGLYADTNSPYETPAPEITFSSSSTSIKVAKGSTEVVKIIVYSSTKSQSTYSLTVSVTTGCASICNLVFVSRGENNPCIQDVQPTQRVSADGNITYSSATIDIGELVNIGDIGSQTIQTSNEIIFEAAVNIPSSVLCGAVDLQATLSYNNDADTITNSISMDVVNEATLTSNDTVYLSSVPPYDTSVTAAIGEVLTWKVQMHLPEIIDKYQLSITFPVSENEAHLTIVNSSITYVGENIGCFSNDGIQTTYNSSLKSTQMTEMNMKFGEYLSNTGTYKRSQFRQPMLMDDVIEIEFMFQVTDHPANIEGSVQNFTVTVAHSDGRTTNITDGVTVIVVGDEQATLTFDAWAEPFNFTDKNTGDIIKLFGEVELQTSSNAHASNVIFHYILPHYSIMTTLVTFTDIEPNITVTSDGSLEVEYDLLRFTDNPTFEIAITIDHRAEFEAGTTNIQTAIPTDVSYTSLQRPDRSDNVLHYTDLKLLQFGFNALECDKVIGIETDPIDECQMSSSSEQGLYRAIDVQSGSLTGWSPSIRGPPFCGHEYVQLDFLAEMRIVGLSILSAGNDNLNYITNFTLEYSSNGVLWKTILDNITSQPKIFLSSFNDATKSLSDAIYIGLEANDIFVASKLRLYPKDSNNGLSCRPFLRFDAIGCRVQFDSNIGSCSTQASSTFPLREREYIVDDILGNIYACILSEIGGDIVCSRSVDNGSTWEEIPGIGNILGLCNNESSVTGISLDGSSRMCSYDEGITWSSCNDDEFIENTDELDYIQSKAIPFNDFQNDSPATMFPTFGFTSVLGEYTGTMSGISIQETGSGSWVSLAQWGDSDWMNI